MIPLSNSKRSNAIAILFFNVLLKKGTVIKWLEKVITGLWKKSLFEIKQ